MKALLAGGVAIFPTDTVYGIGALPQYSAALHRIYKLKDRPLGMPLPLLISDIAQVRTISSFESESLHLLAKAFGQVHSPWFCRTPLNHRTVL